MSSFDSVVLFGVTYLSVMRDVSHSFYVLLLWSDPVVLFSRDPVSFLQCAVNCVPYFKTLLKSTSVDSCGFRVGLKLIRILLSGRGSRYCAVGDYSCISR